jgi:hypothetical protein
MNALKILKCFKTFSKYSSYIQHALNFYSIKAAPTLQANEIQQRVGKYFMLDFILLQSMLVVREHMELCWMIQSYRNKTFCGTSNEDLSPSRAEVVNE